MERAGKSLSARIRLQVMISKRLNSGKECRVWHIGSKGSSVVRHYIDPVSKLTVAEEIKL